MYNFYVPPQSYKYLKERYPDMELKQLNANVVIEMNNYLRDNCQYMLIFMDYHFKKYIPIIVTNTIDDQIVILFEFMYNPETNIAEIYNICTHLEYRRNGYAKGLKNVFDSLQNVLTCDLWIAVASNNPMYQIAVDIYIKMGFVHDIKVSYKTPSDVFYPAGFIEMRRNYKPDNSYATCVKV